MPARFPIPVQPTLEMTVLVRPIVESDVAAADRVLRAPFERDSSFEAHLRLTQAIQPDGVLVAVEGGRLVGTVGAVDYGALAYVGLMAVEPASQGRGIGRLLITRLLEGLDARGCPLVLLDATDKGAALYETLGFTDDGVARVFERPGVPVKHSEGAAPAELATINRATPTDFDEISDLDRRCFGADRRRLLSMLEQDYRDRCLVARDRSSRLVGYLFARDPVLGPWVAENPQVAEELLAAALTPCETLRFQSPPLVMVPRSNDPAAELLVRHGFSQRRRLRHMRRGGTPRPGEPGCLFGQSSFAHG